MYASRLACGQRPSALRPAAVEKSIATNIASTCGMRTAAGTSSRKRVMAGRAGNTARSSPRSRRTWYSSLPATG